MSDLEYGFHINWCGEGYLDVVLVVCRTAVMNKWFWEMLPKKFGSYALGRRASLPPGKMMGAS